MLLRGWDFESHWVDWAFMVPLCYFQRGGAGSVHFSSTSFAMRHRKVRPIFKDWVLWVTDDGLFVVWCRPNSKVTFISLDWITNVEIVALSSAKLAWQHPWLSVYFDCILNGDLSSGLSSYVHWLGAQRSMALLSFGWPSSYFPASWLVSTEEIELYLRLLGVLFVDVELLLIHKAIF